MSFLQCIFILFVVILINAGNTSITDMESTTLSVYEEVAAEILKRGNDFKRDQQQLKIDRETLEEEKKQMQKSIETTDVISLNVGGEIIMTTRETLTQSPKSILAVMFNGRWEHKLQNDKNGNIVFDFNPILFRHLLDQLQTSDPNNSIHLYPPSQPSLVKPFQKMIHKLGLHQELSLKKNIIHFNVDGQFITNQRTTFTQISNSTFDTIISSSNITKFDDKSDAFVDYHPKLFQHLIKQLREKPLKNLRRLAPPSNEDEISFKRMLNDFSIFSVCSSACSNGGTCSSRGVCICTSQWSGSSCTTPVCSPSCSNGGTCSNPGTCTCLSTWSGPRCTTPVCSSRCSNGGTCSSPGVCTCTSQWSGSMCTTPVCSPSCSNGGTCSSPGTCTCTNTWSGSACTVSTACPTGYTRAPLGACVNTAIDFNNCGTVGHVCSVWYISCSYGNCSSEPAVMLPGAISQPGWGGSASVDDKYLAITVPFSISMYGYSTRTPSIQSNGVICLGGCSTAHANTILPNGNFSGSTVFGFWDDLYLRANTSQSVYYATTGAVPNRNLVFEFYASTYATPSNINRFQIIFYENSPGIVSIQYYQATDRGTSATIGVQSSGSGPSMTYAVNNATAVPAGSETTTTSTLILIFNTNTNTYKTSG